MKKLFLTLIITLSALLSFAQSVGNPSANPAAVVDAGKVRFTVLTPQMIRIQSSTSSLFEDRATFSIVNRDLPVPEFTTTEDDTYLYINTSALQLRYRKGRTISPTAKNGSTLQITMTVNGQEEVWYPGKDDAQNLRGTMRTLDNIPGDTHRGDLEQGIISRSGWAVIDESPNTKRGDGSRSYAFEPQEDDFDWVSKQVDNASNAYDWYFLGYGHDYKQAISDFTKVAGKVPLPPKYMFGYWYSRYWAYTSAEFQQIVKDVEKYDIPMDIMIMDMDWHKSGWTGWSWNRNLIPNPSTLISYMHRHGLKVALNLHPADGIGTHEDHYQDMKRDLGDKAHYAPDGAILWTIEDRDFSKSFFKNIIRPLEKDGVDFWWLDWQQQRTVGGHANERGYQCPDGMDGLGETFWCNHTFFNDMAKNRPDRRPIIYHRWGGLGSHRYQIGFSGDTYPTWATLQWQPYFTSTASNVGYGYWGHDLGGHQYSDDCNDPERYLRWMQFGVFTPIFRTHATNDGRIERRIWKFDNFDQLRETVVLRYALFPYIYTAARQAYDTGVCINRPLYYDYPEVSAAYQNEDEYMFGDNILVAPVTTAATGDSYAEKVSQRTTWLPEGCWWDVAKNRLVNGNVTFHDTYTLDEIPYFYKAGSVIVNYPYQRTVQTTPDVIILKVAPGAAGTGSFYEDAGDNADYDTSYAMTRYAHTSTETSATLTIGSREGQFEGMPTVRTYQVEFLGAKAEPTAVTVNGTATDADSYAFDAETGVITVNVPMESLTEEKTIVVTAPFVSPITLTDCSSPAEVAPEANPKLWITGSAVPGGTQPLEVFPNNYVKFHGTLQAGEFYIINTDGIKEGTKYYAPKYTDTNIVSKNVKCTVTTSDTNAAWKVTSAADNYRFTISTNDYVYNGELYKWNLEMYIGGGCVAENQSDKWHTALFQPFTQSASDRNVWTWVGELKNIPGNVESNRFKLMCQKDWGPAHFHPYKADEPLLGSTQMNFNGDDNKWTISKDGYYRITVDAFRETISAEYLGTEEPSGIEAIRLRETDHSPLGELEGATIFYNAAGVETPTMQKGLNIVKDKNGNTSKIIK